MLTLKMRNITIYIAMESISWNVVSLNIFVHDVLYYKGWTDKRKNFKIFLSVLVS